MLGMITGLIPGLSTVKIALLVAAAVAAGLFYWHYTSVKSERDSALAQVGAYQVTTEIQKTVIEGQKDAIKDWVAKAAEFQQTLDRMAANQVQANATAKRLNDVLSRHDLHALSLAKPALVERRVNDGTADILRMFENTTARHIRDSGSNRKAGGNPEGTQPPTN